MLSPLFTWLDRHPEAYWAGAVLATVSLLGWMALGWRRETRGQSLRFATAAFAGLLFLFLLAWRWPFLLCAHEYNPDESQFIAGALTLAHDPLFWRSVDGTTSGPLNFYALLPLHGLGLPLDYFTARFTGLLLTWGLLLALYRLFRGLATPALALVAVLPAVIFFAVVTEPDFVHYSSELVSLALLGAAIATSRRHPLAAAFIAGWLPWAKLQAIPFAGAFVLWQLAVALAAPAPGRARRCLGLLAAAAAPSLLWFGLLSVTGQFSPFWHRYVLQNIVYAGGGGQRAPVLEQLWRQASATRLFPLWAAAGLLGAGAAAIGYSVRRQAPSRYFWLGLVLTLAAGFAIVLPARPSLHYALLLTVPLLLWGGAALCDLAASPGFRRLLTGLAVAGALGLLVVRWTQPAPEMIGQLADQWQMPRTALTEVLHHWQRDGARLALWGWTNSAYAESGLAQGVRDTLTGWSIQPSPQRAYYRAAFLDDFQQAKPEIFVDAVGPGAQFFSDRAMLGHETFPELAALVATQYRPVIELGGSRVYGRRDFLAAHPLGAVELKRLVGRGRPVYDYPRRADTVVPAAEPWTKVNGESYQMLEPNTELQWRLSGEERSVVLRFGFEPRAYLEGRTDGAEVIAELRMPGRPPLRIASRWLDPVGHPADRGTASLQAELPPYPSGTVLAVRCSPGPVGNAAWDWLYFDQLSFARSPYPTPRQFPGFNRRPDQVEVAYPQLVHDEAEELLVLPAPATLTFELDGTERQLSFAYGLREPAYTGEGRSDGVVYEVDLLSPGAAPRRLYDRWIEPRKNAADRGRQQIDVPLPAGVRPGDRLVLRIGAGASDAWDWSYISALTLH